MKSSFFLGLLVLVSGSAFAEVPILRFHEVSPGIYRGARPETVGIQALAKLHIKTVLDLENDDDVVDAERADAAKAGLRFISMPLSGFWAPNDGEIDQILSIVGDRANYPLFIHCTHGQDRTGLIVGLHRVFHEGRPAAQAYQEMLDLGFHTELFLLNHYFEEKTGFED